MKNSKKLVFLCVIPLLILILSSLLFRQLYYIDNKYTWKGTQPICGLLSLSDDDLEQCPLRYLIREWEFYPNVTFTPETFSEKPADTYRQYVSVGQYGGMETGNTLHSPHGCGTYRLTLQLPAGVNSYALELPEIYSSYRLYLDGELLLQSGDPNPESYTPEVSCRMAIFQGGGTVSLLLAVTDHSWIYSGMVYPPAFGTVEAVSNARETRYMLRIASLLLASFGVFLSLYMGFRARWKKGFLYALLCLCHIGYTAFPLLTGFFTIKIQPWYTLNLSCFYIVLLLVVILQNNLCHVKEKYSILWTVVCAAGVILSIGTGISASSLNLNMLMGFSAVSAILKYGTGIYLLITSAAAFFMHKKYTLLLFYASVVFSASLLADRTLPLYEPVYGARFIEIGGAAIMLALFCVLCGNLAEAYRHSLTMAEEHRQMERQLAMQKDHYRQLTDQISAARTASHDLRHHMRALRGMADKDSLDDIRRYLAEYEPSQEIQDVVTYSNNPAADAILHYYASAAAQVNAAFDAVLLLPETLDFTDADLCILLGNLMENAVEACSRQHTGKRFIILKGKTSSHQLRLVADNSFDGTIHKKDGHFYSAKRNGIGLGIQSVQAVVERHGGLVSFEEKDNIFQVSVLIPLEH